MFSGHLPLSACIGFVLVCTVVYFIAKDVLRHKIHPFLPASFLGAGLALGLLSDAAIYHAGETTLYFSSFGGIALLWLLAGCPLGLAVTAWQVSNQTKYRTVISGCGELEGHDLAEEAEQAKQRLELPVFPVRTALILAGTSLAICVVGWFFEGAVMLANSAARDYAQYAPAAAKATVAPLPASSPAHEHDEGLEPGGVVSVIAPPTHSFPKLMPKPVPAAMTEPVGDTSPAARLADSIPRDGAARTAVPSPPNARVPAYQPPPTPIVQAAPKQ